MSTILAAFAGGAVGFALVRGLIALADDLRRWYGHRSRQTDSGSAAGTSSYSQFVAQSLAASRAAGTADRAGASPCVVEQEIVAERAWNLTHDGTGPLLWSACHQVPWFGPTLEADALPTAANQNGIYAQKSLEQVYGNCAVVGTVALSGRTVEGENGYRAQRATIRSLRLRYLPPATPDYYLSYGMTVGSYPLEWKDRPWVIAAKLADRYQCECEIDWLPQSGLPAELVDV